MNVGDRFFEPELGEVFEVVGVHPGFGFTAVSPAVADGLPVFFTEHAKVEVVA